MFPEPQDLAGPTPSSGGVVGSPLALEQFRRLGIRPRRNRGFHRAPEGNGRLRICSRYTWAPTGELSSSSGISGVIL